MTKKIDRSLTINEWINHGKKLLSNNKNISNAQLDCLIILESTLKIPRYKIFAQLDSIIPTTKIYLLKKRLIFRYLNLPLAYIVNEKDFYGRKFFIDNQVLIPRPESELIIDLVKYIVQKLKKQTINSKFIGLYGHDLSMLDKSLNYILKQKRRDFFTYHIKVVDVGTGSGNLGISVHLEVHDSIVEIVDISKNALKTAKINVNKFATDILVTQNNLLQNIEPDYDIVIANLPYVPFGLSVTKSTLHEPFSSIFSNNNGLALYDELFGQLSQSINKPLYIIIEKLPVLDNGLSDLLSKYSLKPVFKSAFIDIYAY